MTIGIDLSVLQTAHRMRGIGATAINFINGLSEKDRVTHNFVFYFYESETSPLDLLNLDKLNYEVRYINDIQRINLRLPGKLKIINGVINQTRAYRDVVLGDSRIHNTKDVDAFVQFDQSRPVPGRHKVNTFLILYDIIPYIMESDYLWSYKTARSMGKTRLGALRANYHRQKYITRLRKVAQKANGLIAISSHTKSDFIKHVGIAPERIKVCHLGITKNQALDTLDTTFSRFELTSWGYVRRNVSLKDRTYLLFVGGADPRRKLIELVASINNLRARGNDIDLVLAGDTMNGAFSIPNDELQAYFRNTSYLSNIHFVGFVTDVQRDWLYKNALAFVYPSVYEGFGLPILEAMQYGTPVITFDNSSIREIAGDAALYAKNFLDIVENVKKLQTNKQYRKAISLKGISQASNYTWAESSHNILSIIAKN